MRHRAAEDLADDSRGQGHIDSNPMKEPSQDTTTSVPERRTQPQRDLLTHSISLACSERAQRSRCSPPLSLISAISSKEIELRSRSRSQSSWRRIRCHSTLAIRWLKIPWLAIPWPAIPWLAIPWLVPWPTIPWLWLHGIPKSGKGLIPRCLRFNLGIKNSSSELGRAR